MKNDCAMANQNQENPIKHWARIRKESWQQMHRYSIKCAYCNKKYSIISHIIGHLGIREEANTWPTCTRPIKPGDISLTERRAYMQGKLVPGKEHQIENANERARKQMQEKRDRQAVKAVPARRIALILNTRTRGSLDTAGESDKRKNDTHNQK